MKEEVFQCIKSVILDVSDIDADDISIHDTFEKLNLESLDFIELQVVLKKKYEVFVKPNLFVDGKVKNIDQLCDYIVNKIDENESLIN